MSQVTVTYGTRQIKVKCTPSTLLGEMKRNACSVLRLDPAKYDLKHGKSIVSPALPFRLSNIVQNGKLQLVPAKGGRSGGRIRLKLAILDLPSNFSGALQGEFDSGITLWNVLRHFENKSGINITQRAVPQRTGQGSGRLVYEAPTVQLFNKLIKEIAAMDKPLTEFGLESGNAVLNVRFEQTDILFENAIAMYESFTNQQLASTSNDPTPPDMSDASSESAMTPSEDSVPVLTEDETAMTKNSTTGQPDHQAEREPSVTPGIYKNLEVYLPSDGPPRTLRGSDDQPEQEMTPSQFARYQAHLKNTYDGSHSRPLMTKALREAAEQEKTAKVKSVSIRIRLPDESHVHATFNGADTIASVYDFMRSMLRTPENDFILFTTPPRYVPKLDERLAMDLKFGARVVMFFEWSTNARSMSDKVLKDEVLSQAKSIADSVSESPNAERISSSSGSGTNPTKPKLGGFKPKWMKLGK